MSADAPAAGWLTLPCVRSLLCLLRRLLLGAQHLEHHDAHVQHVQKLTQRVVVRACRGGYKKSTLTFQGTVL